MDNASDITFGLLGRTLGHSWSPQIHAKLGSIPYSLVELEPDEVARFIHEGSWQGLNVTIPYKREAAAAADVRSERVEALGVANTLTHDEQGLICAENTDVLGFSHLVSRFAQRELGLAAHEAFGGRKVLVLGSGGAAQAAHYALEHDFGTQVITISRKGPDDYASILEHHRDAALIVNTTPVGMYPHCPESPLPKETLAQLLNLSAVIDVVYNPQRTQLMMYAEELGIPSESGLGMLVAQAHYASELFQSKTLDVSKIDEIESDIERSVSNIVLIGMPASGKTGAGRRLAHSLHRPFVDIDDAIELEIECSIPDYFAAHGEAAFRAQETKVLAKTCRESGVVIACGGGVVTQPENYQLLHQNGIIIMLDRPLEELVDDNRPLSQQKGVAKLAEERMPLYRSWADIILTCTGSAAGDAQAIQELLGL